LRLCFLSAELSPLAQSGGLGDAVRGLAGALVERGHEVVCALPAYRCALDSPDRPPLAEAGIVHVPLPGGELRGRWLAGKAADGIDLRLCDLPELYARDGLYGDAAGPFPDEPLRFAALARAGAALAVELAVDALIAHDWHAALAPCLLREVHGDRARRIGSVQVVHNNAYQGRFDAEAMSVTGLSPDLFRPEGLEFYGSVCLLKAGLLWADRIVAVSPTYAREVRTPAFGEGLEGVYERRAAALTGIANGLDCARFDPSADPALAAPFGADGPDGKELCREALLRELGLETPEHGRLCAAVGRFAPQKGWDILADALETLIARGASIALLGDGDPALGARLRACAERHPDRVSLAMGWDERLARRLYAGADCTLIPSRYEPCGLVQLLSQRYGALPIAHRVGGLVDTIEDGRTGILFTPLAAWTLTDAVDRAASLFAARGARAVRAELLALDVSWSGPGRLWEALLAQVARERGATA
jgi:starch synthase